MDNRCFACSEEFKNFNRIFIGGRVFHYDCFDSDQVQKIKTEKIFELLEELQSQANTALYDGKIEEYENIKKLRGKIKDILPLGLSDIFSL